MKRIPFYELTLPELKTELQGLGKESFRAEQLFRWIYGERCTDYDRMTNLSKAFRTEMSLMLDLTLPKVLTHLKSRDGTQKFLFEMGGGFSVEAVLIPSEGRRTLCLSSEIGCNMACDFCFTGKQKLKRRLTAGEIVGQFVQVMDRLDPGERITNIVYMGMGEPLDNVEAVFRSIEIFHSPWGLNLSRKKITVSTSGIVPMISKVTEAGVRLAVSLNASNNEVRTRVMPINKRWPIEDLLEACREHCAETGDKVTVEYVLMKDVTDSLEHARELVYLLRDVPSKINIIPFNEHPDSGFVRPPEERIVAFHSELMRLGAHVLRRKTMGRDIYAACGQLTSAHKNHPVSMTI
jgi:23S rRNA (adenine2503-C2)-methyltransferase